MVAGERVRLRSESFLRFRHPELANAVGIVSSTMHRNGDALLHVRFAGQNVVALNTLATHFEPVTIGLPREQNVLPTVC